MIPPSCFGIGFFFKIVLQDLLQVVISPCSSCRRWESVSVAFLLAVPFMKETPVLSLPLPPAALGSTGARIPWVPIQMHFLK